jgi:hypothetical protein
MSLVTVNGTPCVRATIRIPRLGVWFADLAVDVAEMISGQVTISVCDGALELKGRAARTGVFKDTAILRVLGGAGGLATEVPAKFYRRCPAKVPLQDILAAAGEELSSQADQSLLNQQLVAWTLLKQKAGEALRTLADELGAVWRVLPDGTVWLGQESWPAVHMPDVDLLSEDPRAHTAVIGTDSPTLLPGTLFLGRRVSMVEHQVQPESVRTMVWFEGETGSGEGDRLTRAVGAIVRHLTAHLDYFALYPSKLVSQNSDRTLELKPDDNRLPGLSKVPIRFGIPGVTVKVASGARVLLGFEGGDPGAPVATLWESGSVTELTIDATSDIKVNGGSAAVAREGDSVHAGFLTGKAGTTPVVFTYTPYDPNSPPDPTATALSGGQITSGAPRFHG